MALMAWAVLEMCGVTVARFMTNDGLSFKLEQTIFDYRFGCSHKVKCVASIEPNENVT